MPTFALRLPDTRPALRAIALLLMLSAVMAPAAAQWAWKDANGRLVYSDRPPPAEVKPGQIVRQPSGNALMAPSTEQPAAATPARTPTLAEREMEFRKRQAERAEAEKKSADESTQAARKAQDCERARGYLKALEDGLRITRTNAQGEREFLDDEQRAAETRRTREAIAEHCK